VKEFKRGKYNFAKLGSEDELYDESIEYFKKDDFKTVINEHPEMKKVIWDLIKEGKFYAVDSKIEEDNPEVSESPVEKLEEKPGEEQTEKSEAATISRKKRSE